MSERSLLLLLTLASTMLLGGIVWYAHLAQVRLPRERWWRWIAIGFALGIVRAWIVFFLLLNMIPRYPWELVNSGTLFVIGIILLFSMRAAARRAQSSSEQITQLLDRTDLHKLEAQIGGGNG